MIVVITNQSVQIEKQYLFLTSALCSGPPSQVELSSSGGAGVEVGGCLGLFQLLPDGGEKAKKASGLFQGLFQLLSDGGEWGSQGPVYRQLHDGDNDEQVHLYRWDTFYCIL